MGCYVYILKSLKDGGFYTGCTGNIYDRLNRHNKGFVTATRYRRPWKLVFSKGFDTYSEVRKRENFIKRQRNRFFIKKLINGIYELR